MVKQYCLTCVSLLLLHTSLQAEEKPLKPGEKGGELWEDNRLGMKFRWCPPGKFTMGSPASEKDRIAEWEAQVQVTHSSGFYLGQYEVTQAEYEVVTGKNPSSFNRERLQTDSSRHPVEQVSWEEAMDFCKKLTAQERAADRLPSDWEYTLPTEAQWEYACRAGTITATAFGDKLESTQANFDGNYPYNGAAEGEYKNQTVAVGSYRANAWNLYDMHGNVWEWCRDWDVDKFPGGTEPEMVERATLRVRCGGGWFNSGWICRSAIRSWNSTDFRNDYLGFRLALVHAR